MGALILKSGNALNPNIDTLEFAAYKERVLTDGGVITDEQAVKDAFSFIATSGISASEVFSATSANWGHKELADKPNKLYSLFGEAGDLDVEVGQTGTIFFNTERYTYPVIEFKNALQTKNGMKSKGSVDNVTSSGICVISKVPVTANNTDYGGALGFTIGEITNPTSSTEAENKARSLQKLNYTRATVTTMPSDWYLTGYANSSVTRPDTLGSLIGMDKWLTAVTFLENGKLDIYNGETLIKSATGTATTVTDGITFNVARARTTDNSVLAYANALYADVAEAWCMVNTSAETMKKLSVRAAQNYGA